VDPCLGFYYPISHPSTIPQVFTQQPPVTANDIPLVAILSPTRFIKAVLDSTHPSAEVEDSSRVVTVDEFLRRSAEKKPTKGYGRRKRRVADLINDLEGTFASMSIQYSCSYGPVVCG
jgi:hypothetical protein